MEVILGCFFENFAQLERNALHARYKRRSMVEYFNILIEGCRRGEQCDAQKTCQEAIEGILSYHDKSMTENGSVCMMGKCHNILYIAVRLCYDWQLKDTPTVAKLLEHIYRCEKTFERIWVGALFGTRAPHFIAGWKSDFEDQEDNLRAVVYYLHHATIAGLEYVCDNGELVRFIDVPIESCGKASPLKILAQIGLPDKFHILLRFGAKCDEGTLENLLIKLDCNNRKYPYNLVDCLQFLLRSITRVNLEPLSGGRNLLLDRFPYLVEDCIIPTTRCGIQPPELKHLCRCAIRERLWQNHQLPNGIRMLSIPESLQKYVDLLVD